ncbi:putative mannan endo-1,4-beta-mannosidase C [Phytophthora ramorum]|uniref:putative mannan endo-1,4-beta-mannosidase C n=1 Tax=Phytophthora ramorum TaxID=164328 RepID=UPI0030AA8E89|nr:putative mannan endo-1,4-beta-mannosidase C [Phytophthora ramorum]
MKVLANVVALVSLAIQATTAGFVKTSGTAFEVDGEPFYIFGTNSYWASEINWSETDLAAIFTTMAQNDITVCRSMGFADLTTVGTTPYNIVYQLWENGVASINTKDNGLGYFDKVVAAAKAAGVKLVVPLVNNWSDYGGMDVYVKQLGGKYHDDFYTDAKIKAAYKKYIATFVKRYKENDTIMSWELCNECRCAGSGGGMPESGTCTTKTINDWMTEMSAYIKSLDSNHLVATGSEGFMNTDSSVYLYSGLSGVDFDANLAIKSIDYGAYHTYPDGWSVDASEFVSWGRKWINDHVASGKKAGKPVVMEEYGVKSHNASVYKAWSDAVYAAGSSMQYWEFGLESLKTYRGDYTIYDTDEIFKSTIVPAAKKFKARRGSA